MSSISLFSRNVFSAIKIKSHHLSKNRYVDCKAFNFVVLESVNSLPDDKILDWSKLKQIADDILKCI